MPQLIPAILAAVSAMGALKAILFVGIMAYSSSQQRKAERRARAEYNASQVDRLVNIGGTTQPRELVLGRVRKGGFVFFRGSIGTYREKFVMCVAIAAHEIDGVEQVYLNDVAVTLDPDGWVQTEPYLLTRTASGSVTGATAPPEAIPGTISTVYADGEYVFTTVTAYQYYVETPKARIRAYMGGPGPVANAQLLADFPDLWTVDHIADGAAWLLCEFWYDETAFPSGLPTVTAVVRGAKCYDPRTSLTAFTENPAIHQRHVLTHPYFGKRTSLTANEEARIIAAANSCDTALDYGGDVGSVAMYRSSIVLPYGTAARDALDDLSQAMAGQWAYAAGEFFTRAGVYTAPVLTLTDADLAVVRRDGEGASSQQAIGISTHRARADKFNVVTPRIWDAAQDYKQVPLDPLKGAALITRDGAELAQEVTMPAVFCAQQALHVAGVALRDARDPLTVTLPFKLAAYRVELFDTVALTLARYGWSAKTFMVVQRQWTLEGLLQLTLKETTAAIYQPDAEFAAGGYAQNTSLPRPWDISPPAGLAATSGTDELLLQDDGTVVTRVRVAWTPIVDPSLLFGGSVEVQWSLAAETLRWNSASTSAADSQILLQNAPDGLPIVIRARTRNSVAASDWCAQLVHTVLGKTEPPPPFDVFQVLAQPDGTRQFNFSYTATARPVDWMGAEIRYLTGTHTEPAWETMEPLQDDRTHYTASPVEVNQLLSGPHTFSCRSLDTTGNLSTAKFVQITLPPRRLGDTVAEFSEADTGWAGALTDCEVNTAQNRVEASSGTTWADLTTWDAWTRWNMDPATPIVYVSPVRDLLAVLTCLVDVSASALGDVTISLRSSQTSDDPDTDPGEWTAWGAADARVVARYIQVRASVAATGPQPVPVLSALSYVVSAPIITEYINDLDISTLTGSYRIGTGDVRVPLENTYGSLLEIQVVIQDSSTGGWSWALIDKTLTYGPRVQFRLAGTLADPALVDFIVKGF